MMDATPARQYFVSVDTLFLQRSERSYVNHLLFTLYWKKRLYAGNTQQAAILSNIINQFRLLFSTVCVNEPVSILRGDMKKVFLVLKFKWIFNIWMKLPTVHFWKSERNVRIVYVKYCHYGFENRTPHNIYSLKSLSLPYMILSGIIKINFQLIL